MRNSVVTLKKCARRCAATLIALALLFALAGTAAAAGSQYTIHRTSGISWHADLWVLMYCRKGYTAVHGGYAKPPSGLKIKSSGPLSAGGLEHVGNRG